MPLAGNYCDSDNGFTSPGGMFCSEDRAVITTIVCVTSLCKHNQYDNLAVEQMFQSLEKGVLSTGLWLRR